MPTPGGGTGAAGDSPQEVLMIISDGVNDEDSSGRVIAPINTLTTWCNTIKARNIRIAFLYLTYNPLPTNSFYVANVEPSSRRSRLTHKNCASPGLYFEVNTNGDITTALATLFQKAISTARLTQ